MSEAVLWLVLWLMFLSMGAPVILLLVGGLGALVEDSAGVSGLGDFGLLIGGLLGVVWSIFALYQVFMQIISIVQLL